MIYEVRKLKKIQVYINRRPYKTAAQIKRETGCDLIFNGQFFNMSDGSPCQTLKVNGEILSYEGQDYSGFGWNGDGENGLVWTNDKDAVENLITCNPLLADGERLSLEYAPANTVRGKMAMGVRPDGTIIVFGAQNGSEEICDLNGLQDRFLNMGCSHALALDGGGSVTLLGPGGSLKQTRFPLYFFICIWGEAERLPESVYMPQIPIIYRVQVGAFKMKLNADRLRERVRELEDLICAGYSNAYVRKIGGLYKVQVGAFSRSAGAERVLNDLQNHGFAAFITTE